MNKSFLKRFWDPHIQCLPDKSELKPNERFSYSKKKSLNVLIEANKSKPMWLFFQPNWNIWVLNNNLSSWEKWIRWDKNAQSDSYNALRIDFDIKDTNITCMDEYYKKIIGYMQIYAMRPSLMSKSWWWYHAYYVIKPEDRTKVYKLWKKNFLLLIRFINNLFRNKFPLWWDASSVSLDKLMRVPWSLHKKGEPKIVECFSITEDRERSDDLENINLFSFQHYQHALKQIDDFDTSFKSKKKLEWTIKKEVAQSIASLSFPDVFSKLERYPRVNSKGEKYFFQINTDRTISIVYKDHVYNPDGYKYMPSEWWYVNNFTDQYYDIKERPRWPMLPFLYHYFGSMYKVNSFLKKEFDLSVFSDVSGEEIDDEDIYMKIDMDDYEVSFTSRRVIVQYILTTGDKQKVIEKTVIKKPIAVTWRAYTYKNQQWLDTDKKRYIYVFVVDGEIIKMERQVTKLNFNKVSDRMFWYGNDDELGMFFEALDACDDIDNLDPIEDHWYHKNWLYLLWRLVMWSDENTLLCIKKTEDKMYEGEQVPTKEYLKKLQCVWTDKYAVPSFLQILAMCWLNKRTDMTIYPSLLLTGTTTSGKSTLAKYLKQAIWYDDKTRTRTLQWMSAQPVKKYMSDTQIIHREEITGEMKAWVEPLLRNLVNRDGTETWTYWWENIVYDLRSPVIATWERAFTEESINNRFLCIPMSPKVWHAWWKPESLDWYTSRKYIYENWMVEDRHRDICYKRRRWLRKESDLSDRQSDVRWYVFAMNEMFDMWFDTSELVEHARKHLSMMWFGKKKKWDPYKRFQSLLVRWLATKKIAMSYYSSGMWSENYVFDIFFIDERFEQSQRAVLNQMVSELKEYDIKIEYSFSNITVRFQDSVDSPPADKVICNLLLYNIRPQFKYVINHVTWILGEDNL